MKFSYQFFRDSYFPIIPLTIIKNNKKINTSAVVDSGAAISIFNSRVTTPIELDIESGEKHIFQGASAKLIGYIHKVRMVIGGSEIECEVAFSDELSTSFNLLGRQGVFDNFRVCFDGKTVEFAPR